MNLLKLLATISSVTIFSRISGFIRDTTIAYFFGATGTTDAFFIAFRLPNLLRRMFAEGAFAQAFIPILMEYKTQEGNEASRIFISYISGLLTLVLAIISLIGTIAAPWIIYVTAHGFVDTIDKFNLTVRLLRITFPYILLISLVSLAGAILNTWNRFSVPAFTPILLNISMIMSLLFLAKYCDPPIIALAWGVFIGGILQLLYQLPSLKEIGMLVLPRISFRNKNIRRVIKSMWPAVIGVSVNQISLIMNTIFGSCLQTGSISWIYYADRLMEFPTGVLGAALNTILLPSLAKSFSIKNHKEYQYLIDWGLRVCFLLALPCAIALSILAQPLIISLFQYGNFTAHDTIMTQKVLIAYCVGLIGLIIVKVLAPGFYSRHDIKTPTKIAIFTLLLTQLMIIVFTGPMKHAGLALSISLAACINAVMLYWQLRRKSIFNPLAGWGKFLIKLIAVVIIMVTVLLLVLNYMPEWEHGNMLMRIMRLLLVIFAGTASYFIALFIFGFRIQDFYGNRFF